MTSKAILDMGRLSKVGKVGDDMGGRVFCVGRSFSDPYRTEPDCMHNLGICHVLRVACSNSDRKKQLEGVGLRFHPMLQSQPSVYRWQGRNKGAFPRF